MVRWLDHAPVGLKEADWALKGMGGQRNTGSGWQSLAVGGVKQDVPLWVAIELLAGDAIVTAIGGVTGGRDATGNTVFHNGSKP